MKFAVCELVDYLKDLEDKGGKEIASEKVGTYSVTYAVADERSDLVNESKET